MDYFLWSSQHLQDRDIITLTLQVRKLIREIEELDHICTPSK